MRAYDMQIKSIPLHIEREQKDGTWFARCPEFDVVAHGDSELQAAKNLFDMLQRSISVAAVAGDLEKILRKAGVKLVVGFPVERGQADRDELWYVPVSSDAHTASIP